jgi:uncharacterized protein YndB with AHSA1/START domain
MQYKAVTEFPLTDAACKEATGKTLKQWYAWLDALGERPGRRDIIAKMYVGNKLPVWWAITIAVEYETHCGLKKKDGRYEGYGICVNKTIAAPLDKLYTAWVSAGELSKWFGAGMKAEVAECGAYSNKDGDRGKFLRVRPGKSLRLSWENPALCSPTMVDVTFSDKGWGKSHVMLNHTRIQTRSEADGLRAGWLAAFDKLKKLLEA